MPFRLVCKGMKNLSKRVVTAAFLMVLTMVGATETATARSPLPYFRGLEQVGVYCGKPAAAGLRDRLCEAARTALEALLGIPVPIGPSLLADPAAITVLVNAHEVDGPSGMIWAVTLDLFRRGQVDGKLTGTPPILLANDEADTVSKDFRIKLEKALKDLVVDPWLVARPAGTNNGG